MQHCVTGYSFVEFKFATQKCRGAPDAQTIRTKVPLSATNTKNEPIVEASSQQMDELYQMMEKNVTGEAPPKQAPLTTLKLPTQANKPNLITEVDDVVTVASQEIVPEYEIVHRGSFNMSDYTNARVRDSLIGVPEALLIKIKMPKLV